MNGAIRGAIRYERKYNKKGRITSSGLVNYLIPSYLTRILRKVYTLLIGGRHLILLVLVFGRPFGRHIGSCFEERSRNAGFYSLPLGTVKVY